MLWGYITNSVTCVCMAFTEVLCPYNLLSMFGSARHIIKPERGIARGLIQQQFQNDLMI